ncbi:hypothetical protein RI054_13g67600 [Pseudoscourfieldia marina]
MDPLAQAVTSSVPMWPSRKAFVDAFFVANQESCGGVRHGVFFQQFYRSTGGGSNFRMTCLKPGCSFSVAFVRQGPRGPYKFMVTQSKPHTCGADCVIPVPSPQPAQQSQPAQPPPPPAALRAPPPAALQSQPAQPPPPPAAQPALPQPAQQSQPAQPPPPPAAQPAQPAQPPPPPPPRKKRRKQAAPPPPPPATATVPFFAHNVVCAKTVTPHGFRVVTGVLGQLLSSKSFSLKNLATQCRNTLSTKVYHLFVNGDSALTATSGRMQQKAPPRLEKIASEVVEFLVEHGHLPKRSCSKDAHVLGTSPWAVRQCAHTDFADDVQHIAQLAEILIAIEDCTLDVFHHECGTHWVRVHLHAGDVIVLGALTVHRGTEGTRADGTKTVHDDIEGCRLHAYTESVPPSRRRRTSLATTTCLWEQFDTNYKKCVTFKYN